MSMFDTVWSKVKCPLCGEEKEYDVQFKLTIGRAFSPELRSVHVGDLIEDMPPIARVEADGYVGFTCCPDDDEKRTESALIVFEFSRLTSLVYPLPEDHKWARLPRSRLAARRDAAREERFERGYRKWRDGEPKMAKDPRSRMIYAMVLPLRVSLDYSGIGRRLLRTGEVRGSYWRPSPGAPWARREECPL